MTEEIFAVDRSAAQLHIVSNRRGRVASLTRRAAEDEKLARLFVAAPGMLEALKSIAEALSLDPEDYSTQSLILSAEKGRLREARDKLRRERDFLRQALTQAAKTIEIHLLAIRRDLNGRGDAE